MRGVTFSVIVCSWLSVRIERIGGSPWSEPNRSAAGPEVYWAESDLAAPPGGEI